MPLYAAPLPFIGSYTFAQLKALTGMQDGAMAFVTNYPANKGSTWRYSTTVGDWFPMAPCKVFEKTALTSGVAQLADQLLLAIPLEAALLTNKVFRLLATFGKSGVVDNTGTFSIRLGTAGSTADTAIASAGAIGAGSKSVGFDVWNRMASATSVEKLGGGLTAAFNGTGSSSALNQATAVSNVTSQAVFLSLTTAMAGTTDTPQLGYIALELMP